MVSSLMLLVATIGKISAASRIRPISFAREADPQFPMSTNEANTPEVSEREGAGQSWHANERDIQLNWRDLSQSLVEVSKSDVEVRGVAKLYPILTRPARAFNGNPIRGGAHPKVLAGRRNPGLRRPAMYLGAETSEGEGERAAARAAEVEEVGEVGAEIKKDRYNQNVFQVLAGNFARNIKSQAKDMGVKGEEEPEEDKEWDGTGTVDTLLQKLRAGDARARAATAALGSAALEMKDSAAVVPILVEYLQQAEPTVRVAAAKALEQLGPRGAAAVPALAACITDADPYMRAPAALALGSIGQAEAVPALIEGLKDARMEVRWSAARALGKIGAAASAAASALEALQADGSENVRSAAAAAVAKVTQGNAAQTAVAPPVAAEAEYDSTDVARAFLNMPIELDAEHQERLLAKNPALGSVFRRAEFWNRETATLLEVINVLGRFEKTEQWQERMEFSTVKDKYEESEAVGQTKRRYELAQKLGCAERAAFCQNAPKLPFTNSKLAASVGLTVEDFADLPVSKGACNIVFDALAQSKNSLIPYGALDARTAGLLQPDGSVNELAFNVGLYKSRALIILAWFLFGKGNFVWVVMGAKVLHDMRPDLIPTPQDLGLFKIGAFI